MVGVAVGVFVGVGVAVGVFVGVGVGVGVFVGVGVGVFVGVGVGVFVGVGVGVGVGVTVVKQKDLPAFAWPSGVVSPPLVSSVSSTAGYGYPLEAPERP